MNDITQLTDIVSGEQLKDILSVYATKIKALETRIAALEDAGDTSATITLDQWEE